MTQIIKSRKERANFTIEQKLDYAKLMVNENYSNKKIIAISGAGPSAVTRWKKQYLAEISGQTPKSSKAKKYNRSRNNSGVRKGTMKS